MADSTMKTLLDGIITFLEAGVTAGDIESGTDIIKGLSEDIEQIAKSKKRYVAIDDGGERTETEGMGDATQRHVYIINVEIGVQTRKDITTALDRILDLTQEVKDVFEAESNRKLDGMTFGVEITPLTIPENQKFFWRGRQIIIEYHEIEDRYEEF
jgi:hypothetical protein